MNNDNEYYTVSEGEIKPTHLLKEKRNLLNMVFSEKYLQPHRIKVNEELIKIMEETRKIIISDKDFFEIIKKILYHKNSGYINSLKDKRINTLITNLKLIRNFEDPDYDIIPNTIRSEMNGAQESDDYYEMVNAKGRENSVLAIQKNIVNLSKYFLNLLMKTGIDIDKSYAETGGRGKKRKYNTQKKNKSKRRTRRSRRRAFSKKSKKMHK
jgi:hypothetical protein